MEIPPNTIIASGPVIIENNKILLVRENKNGLITPWMFPGGKVEKDDASFEEACVREAAEEIGVKIEIIKKLRTISFQQGDKNIELIHYLAKRQGEIIPGHDIAECDWYDIDDLPKDCAPNVLEIIADYIKETEILEARKEIKHL